MNSAKSTVPFKGTPEQEAELLKVIEEKKGDKGSLMPILQKAQEIYGGGAVLILIGVKLLLGGLGVL